MHKQNKTVILDGLNSIPPGIDYMSRIRSMKYNLLHTGYNSNWFLLSTFLHHIVDMFEIQFQKMTLHRMEYIAMSLHIPLLYILLDNYNYANLSFQMLSCVNPDMLHRCSLVGSNTYPLHMHHHQSSAYWLVVLMGGTMVDLLDQMMAAWMVVQMDGTMVDMLGQKMAELMVD